MFLRHPLSSILFSALLVAGCANQPVSVKPAEPIHMEPLGQSLPQTSARTVLIDQIINKDPVVISSLKPVLNTSTDNDERIAALRKKDGGALPDSYWTLYKQNLEALQYDLNHQHDAARAQYIETYRDELSRVDDGTLQAMATSAKALDEKNRRQWSARMSDRAARYMVTSEQSLNAATDAHLNRMALMDRQYNVCSLNPECWDAPVKK
ncbi:hypothetical protein ACQKQA_00915 [Pseudomonas sp. NPDC089530]|uniref:hypothetical protein n=1 Tax=Pseudomonas sp. NPDC089530 TaxID=3390651 RepID=UPI003D06BC0D